MISGHALMVPPSLLRHAAAAGAADGAAILLRWSSLPAFRHGNMGCDCITGFNELVRSMRSRHAFPLAARDFRGDFTPLRRKTYDAG